LNIHIIQQNSVVRSVGVLNIINVIKRRYENNSGSMNIKIMRKGKRDLKDGMKKIRNNTKRIVLVIIRNIKKNGIPGVYTTSIEIII